MKTIKHCSAFFLALILISAAGCATTEEGMDTRAEDKGQTAGIYMDDSVITTKVKGAIFNEPGLDSAEIGVETYNGTVQLTGFVESRSDINRAVEVTRRVEGVKSVKNDMRVKSRY